MPPKPQQVRSPVGSAPPPPPPQQAQQPYDQQRWVPSASNKRVPVVGGSGAPPPPPPQATAGQQGGFVQQGNNNAHGNQHQDPNQRQVQSLDQNQGPYNHQQQHGNYNNNYNSGYNNGGGQNNEYGGNHNYGGGGNQNQQFGNQHNGNYHNANPSGPMAVDTTPTTLRPTPHSVAPEQHQLEQDADEAKPEAPKKNISLKARGRLPEPKKKAAAAPASGGTGALSGTSPAPQDDTPMVSISESHAVHQHQPYDLSTTSAIASVGTYNAPPPPPPAAQSFSGHPTNANNNNNNGYYNEQGNGGYSGNDAVQINRQQSYGNNNNNNGYNDPQQQQQYGGNFNNTNNSGYNQGGGNNNYGGPVNQQQQGNNWNNNNNNNNGQQYNNQNQGQGQQGFNNYHNNNSPPPQMLDSGSTPPPPAQSYGNGGPAFNNANKGNQPYGGGGGQMNNNQNPQQPLRQPGSPSYANNNQNNYGNNNQNQNYNNQSYGQNQNQQGGMPNTGNNGGYQQQGNGGYNNNNNGNGYDNANDSYGNNQYGGNNNNVGAPPPPQSWRNTNAPPPQNNVNVNNSQRGGNSNAPPPPPPQQQPQQSQYQGNNANGNQNRNYTQGPQHQQQQGGNNWNNNQAPPPPTTNQSNYGSTVTTAGGTMNRNQSSPNGGPAPPQPSQGSQNNRQVPPARVQPQQPQPQQPVSQQQQQPARNRQNDPAVSMPPQQHTAPLNNVNTSAAPLQPTLASMNNHNSQLPLDFDQTLNATASSSARHVRSTNASPMPSASQQLHAGGVGTPAQPGTAPVSQPSAALTKTAKPQVTKQQPQPPQRGGLAPAPAATGPQGQQPSQQVGTTPQPQLQVGTNANAAAAIGGAPAGATAQQPPISHTTNAAASALSYKNPVVSRTALYTLNLPNNDIAVEYYLTKDNGDTSENRKSAGNSIPHLLAPRHQMMNNHPTASASSNVSGPTPDVTKDSITVELASFDSHTYNNIVNFVESVVPMVAAVHGGCAYSGCKCCAGTSAAEVTPLFQGVAALTAAGPKKSSPGTTPASPPQQQATPAAPQLPRTYHHECEYHLKDMWDSFDNPYGAQTVLSTDIMSSSQARPGTVHYSPVLAGLHLSFAPDSKYIRRQQTRSRLLRERARREGAPATQHAGPVEMESSDEDIGIQFDLDSDNEDIDDLELSRSVSSTSSLGTINSASTTEAGATGPSPLLNRIRQNQAITVSAIIHDHRKKISALPEFDPLVAAEGKHPSKSSTFASSIASQPAAIQQLFQKRRDMIQKMKRNTRRNAENIFWVSDENQPDRLPLFEQIETMAKHRYPALMKAKNTDFTFESWVAVLWQPIFNSTNSAKKNSGKFLAFYAIRPPRFLFEPKMSVSSQSYRTTAAGEKVFTPLPCPHSVVGNMCSNLFCVANSNEQGAVIRTDSHALSINVWATGSHEVLQKLILSHDEAPATDAPTSYKSIVMGNNAQKPAGDSSSGHFVPSRAHTKVAASVPIAGLIPIGVRQDIWFMQQHYHYEGQAANSTYTHVAPLFLIAAAANMMHQQQVHRDTKSVLQQGDVSLKAIVLTTGDATQDKEDSLTNPRYTPVINIPEVITGTTSSPLHPRSTNNSYAQSVNTDARVADLARRFELLNNSPVVMPNLSSTRCDMLGRSLACGHKMQDYDQRTDPHMGTFISLTKEMFEK